MTEFSNKSKGALTLTTAPLTNVSLCMKALSRAMDRPGHLPGMVCFYGPSGWGKSTRKRIISSANQAGLGRRYWRQS